MLYEAEQSALQGLSYLNAYFLGRNKDNVRMVRTLHEMLLAIMSTMHLSVCSECVAAP